MEKVIELVLKVLNYPSDTKVDDSFGAETVKEWDSMAQIQIVVEIEDHYGVNLSTDEAMNMDSIGGIKEVLSAKGLI